MRKLAIQLILCAALTVPSAISRPARAEKHPTNACGCYGEINACFCEKKAQCGCPGECEPKGCEEARQKKLQKEIEEETKKARQEEKAQAEKAEAKAKQAAKPSREEDDTSDDDTAAASDKTDRKTDKKTAHESKAAPVPKMTASQKKRLLKLIDAYLAEHPDAGPTSLTDLRKNL